MTPVRREGCAPASDAGPVLRPTVNHPEMLRQVEHGPPGTRRDSDSWRKCRHDVREARDFDVQCVAVLDVVHRSLQEFVTSGAVRVDAASSAIVIEAIDPSIGNGALSRRSNAGYREMIRCSSSFDAAASQPPEYSFSSVTSATANAGALLRGSSSASSTSARTSPECRPLNSSTT